MRKGRRKLRPFLLEDQSATTLEARSPAKAVVNAAAFSDPDLVAELPEAGIYRRALAQGCIEFAGA
jgi:hypothetical protein